MGADQPHNAVRAEELGLALTLDPATASPASLRQTIGAALDDADMRRRARDTAVEINTLPGVGSAVSSLEELAVAPR